MGSFLYELSNGLNSCPDSDNSYYLDELKKLVNNLSPNIIKHIKIAELQDELVKLGFERKYFGLFSYYPQPKTCIDYQYVIEVDFGTASTVTVSKNDTGKEWHYNNDSTFHEDVINKVKELMK